MPDELDNPFVPDAGTPPPLRVGHEELVREMSMMLRMALAKKRGRMVVLYGPRGNGKTVLLDEIRNWAKAGNANVRMRSGGRLAGPLDFAAKILDDDSIATIDCSASVAASVPFAEAELSANPRSTYSFAGVLMKLAESKPTVILIDEAHDLPSETGSALLDAAQECITRRLPLFMVLAGTPHLLTALRNTGADFWERLKKLRIGRLESKEDARKALSVPSAQSGLPFDEDALELLATSSQRYPFFAQQLGWAAWGTAQRKGHTTITLQDAEEGLATANSELEALYQERLDELRAQGVVNEAVAVSRAMLAHEGEPCIIEKDMERLLQSLARSNGSTSAQILEKLVMSGLIWREKPLRWEPAIPSLCTFLVNSID